MEDKKIIEGSILEKIKTRLYLFMEYPYTPCLKQEMTRIIDTASVRGVIFV